MKQTQYLALLRGINVGGNNIIKMSDLKSCFEEIGHSEVTTYIQSGNVIFKSALKDVKKLSDNLETVLSEKFGYKAKIVIVTYRQLKDTVENAPKGFGKDPDNYKYDVMFLKDSHKPEEVISQFVTKEGVDAAYPGDVVIYFSRVKSEDSHSYMPKIIALPVYKFMTIRNWNTTTKLLALMEKTNTSE